MYDNMSEGGPTHPSYGRTTWQSVSIATFAVKPLHISLVDRVMFSFLLISVVTTSFLVLVASLHH